MARSTRLPIAIALVTAALPIAAVAHDAPQSDETPYSAVTVTDLSLEVISVSEGLFVLQGRRAIGNVLVSVGEDGTFMVDDQFEESEPAIRQAIAAMGGSSPRFLINSHYHHDHAGGNAPFGSEGAIIAAHDNTRKLLAEGTEIELLGLTVPQAEPAALPIITFPEEMSLFLNGNHVRLIYLPNGHTSSDIATYLVEANVIHAGDVWNYTGNYPFIDARYGGTLSGMIAGQRAIAGMANEQTVIVPGHGPLATRAELVTYTEILSAIHEILLEHARLGHTLEQVIAARPVDQVHEFSTGIVTQAMWLGIVYPQVVASLEAQ